MPPLRRSFAAAAVALAFLPAGCGTAAAPATPTVTSTVTNTVQTTSTAVETSVVVQTSVLQTTQVLTTTVDVGRPDPDTPGPDGGPACPVDASYHDEAPDGLAADVIAAWENARTAATAAGITLCLNDGKRSRAQQQQTFDDYVTTYGEAAAESYVLPPDRSAHVAGYAVDVQPAAADSWLEQTNGALGFCRMYDNEIWHFEYAATFTLGCPPRRSAPAG